MSSLKQALNEGHFVCVLEVVPQQSPSQLAALEQLVQRGHLAGWPLLPAFADRVGLHSDLSPLEGAGALENPASSLLHFSGKDRERADFLLLMDSMKARGLEQLLLLGGDRLPAENACHCRTAHHEASGMRQPSAAAVEHGHGSADHNCAEEIRRISGIGQP